MILADANLLLYAYNEDAPQHNAARDWLENILSSSILFCLSLQTILAFVRISTNHKAFPNPLNLQEATDIISELLELPNVVVLQPTKKHWALLTQILTSSNAVGPLVTDAHLAALAIEHGVVLYTSDDDFKRFPNLNFVNPLQN